MPCSPSKESWDDDFGDDLTDELLSASISSAAGANGGNGFYQRSLNASGNSSASAGASSNASASASMVNLLDGSKYHHDEFDALHSAILSVPTAANAADHHNHRTSNQPPNKHHHHHNHHQQQFIYNENAARMGHDEYYNNEDTIKTFKGLSIDHTLSSDKNTLTPGSYRQMQQQQQQQRQEERHNHTHIAHFSRNDEDIEDGFDLPEGRTSLQERLEKVQQQRQQNYNKTQDFVVEDFADDESLGFRAHSRLSQSSMFATQSSTATDVEEGLADDELGSGQLDLFSKTAKELNQILSEKRKRQQNMADFEQEQLEQGRKYDTIRSNDSSGKNSTRSYPSDEAEFEDDLLDGFEDGCGDILANPKDTLHRNVVVTNSRNSKGLTKDNASSSGRTLITLQDFNSHQKNARSQVVLPRAVSNFSTVKTKKSFLQPRDLDYQDPDTTLPIRSSGSSNMRPVNLRTVQSMANLGEKHHHSSNATTTRGSKYSRAARKSRVYGDGSELEVLDELTTNDFEERRFMVAPKIASSIQHQPLDVYREKPALKRTNPKHKHTDQESSQRTSRRRMGLIRQLGKGPAVSITSNGMKFDPIRNVWEGNDIELKKFDSLNSKGPGLIKGVTKGAQRVGNMEFDPEEMKWKSISEDRDDDPFAELEDLPEESAASTPSLRGHHHSYSTDFGQLGQAMSTVNTIKGNHDRRVYSMKTQPVSNMTASASLQFDGRLTGQEFVVTPRFVEKLQHEEIRWDRKTKAWYAPGEEIDRKYLWEIRNMVMKRN